MKKSILALCALFIFAGCSVSEESAVNSDWKALVGGKTIVFEGDVEGLFSEDASEFVEVDLPDTVWKIVSSTADSAVYQLGADVTGGGVYEYRFKNVKSTGGDVDMYDDGEFVVSGEFTFKN